MTSQTAKTVIVTLANQSSFFRGYLVGQNAWGDHSFPDAKRESVQHANIVKLFRDLADGVESDAKEAQP